MAIGPFFLSDLVSTDHFGEDGRESEGRRGRFEWNERKKEKVSTKSKKERNKESKKGKVRKKIVNKER